MTVSAGGNPSPRQRGRPIILEAYRPGEGPSRTILGVSWIQAVLARVRRVGAPVADGLVAIVLTASAYAQIAAGTRHTPGVLVCGLVTTANVAWRRRVPAVAALVASGAFAGFELVATGSSLVELAAVALVFFTLGQWAAASRRDLLPGCGSASWSMAVVSKPATMVPEAFASTPGCPSTRRSWHEPGPGTSGSEVGRLGRRVGSGRAVDGDVGGCARSGRNRPPNPE